LALAVPAGRASMSLPAGSDIQPWNGPTRKD
jgi:hypothetical protein